MTSALSISNRQRLDDLSARNWSAVDDTDHTAAGGGAIMTTLLTIPGGDLKARTWYRITGYGDLTAGSVANSGKWQVRLNGSNSDLVALGTSYLLAGMNLEWHCVVNVICRATGGSGTLHVSMTVDVTNLAGGAGTPRDVWTGTWTFHPDTTADITIAPYWLWTTGNDSPVCHGYSALYERLGP